MFTKLPSVGRIVLYVVRGKPLAAMITDIETRPDGHPTGLVSLRVFARDRTYATHSVEHSIDLKEFSWSWPE